MRGRLGKEGQAAANAYAKAYRAANREAIAAQKATYATIHHEEIAAYNAAYYTANRELVRAKDRKSKYGITSEEYAAFVEQQNGVCAICEQPDRRIGVDHDHATGKVRGLLCNHCNRALGSFGDDPERLAQAIRYLNSTR